MTSNGPLSKASTHLLSACVRTLILDCYHLPEGDINKLSDSELLTCYYEPGDGWWLHVSAVTRAQLLEHGYSDNFADLWKWSLEHLIEYIYFSIDGPIIEELPHYPRLPQTEKKSPAKKKPAAKKKSQSKKK